MTPSPPPNTPHRTTNRPALAALCLALCLGLALVLLPGRAIESASGAPEARDAEDTAEGTSRDRALERARAVADALTKDLMGELMSELSAGGPGEAIRVCSEVAQGIAAEHSTGGMTVRRVSRKVRNPADRPDPYEAEQLERLAVLHERNELPEEVSEVVEGEAGSRTLRYLRPITVKPLCLRCHGDPETFAPEVRQVLTERYPEDEATGYRAGDLRGAVSVRVPLD